MKSERAIMLILAALLIREAWLLLPSSLDTFRPFPFYDIEITRPTYIAFACHYAFILIIAFAFIMILPDYRDILSLWFFLQGIEFIDYFLTYNTHWFKVEFWGHSIGIGITFLKLTVLPMVFIFKLWKT